jgi:kynurenine formamidase
MRSPDIGSEASPILRALQIPRSGRLYDLSSGWWRGMPSHPVHPRFEVLTYRSPRGERNQGDVAALASGNEVNYGFVSELVITTMHTGTHIDALCHVTCGERSEWHGDRSSEELLGDFGALDADAAELAPIVARGVLLDIPRLLGLSVLPANFAVGSDELARACDGQGLTIRRGDVALVRTGLMSLWPDEGRMAGFQDAGLSLDAARWLQARNVAAVGADTATCEVLPSGVQGSPQPVHLFLIRENGIPLIEWVNLEELAADGVGEFLFVALPLTIRGATGSMIRPIAIA